MDLIEDIRNGHSANGHAPLASAIKIIGGRWRPLIIYCLNKGTMRFSDLEKRIPNISQRMLSLDLRKLEKEGIITRTVIDEVPIKVEYKLTAAGFGLSAIIRALYEWEREFGEVVASLINMNIG